MPRWTVLYDRECRLCVTIVDVLLSWDRRRRLRSCAIQAADGQALLHAVPEDRRLATFHLAAPGGQVRSGGPALAQLLGLLPGGGPLGALLRRFPRPTAAGYDWIARNRVTLSRPVPSRVKARARRRVEAAERAEPAG